MMLSAAMLSLDRLWRISWHPISVLFFVALANVLWEVLYIFWFPATTSNQSLMTVLLQSLGVLVLFITSVTSDNHSSDKGPSSKDFDRRELPIGASQDQRSPCHSSTELLTRANPCHQGPRIARIRSNAAMHKAALRGDMQTVELELRSMANEGIKPCVKTYNIVLNGFANSKNWRQAEKLIAMMAADGVAPDVVSYTSVISACGKQSGKSGGVRAERWFDRMIAEGIKPNEFSFTAIINAWAKATDVERAVRFLDRMDEAGVIAGVIHYTSVLDACARVGNTCVSAQIFARMRAADIKPNIYSYTAAARALAVNGNYEVIEKMQEENDFQPNEYFVCALIAAYGNSPTPNPARAREALQAAMLRGVPVAGNQAIAKSMSALCRKCHTEVRQWWPTA